MGPAMYAEVLRREPLVATQPPRLGTKSSLGIWRRVAAADLSSAALAEPPSYRNLENEISPPTGTSRNPNGILVRECVVVPASALDMVALRKEAAYLKQHMVIARFVAPLLDAVRHELWITELENRIKGQVICYRDAGGGFFFIKLSSVELVKHVVDLTPCKLQVGTALFQRWHPAFNPCQPTGLVSPR